MAWLLSLIRRGRTERLAGWAVAIGALAMVAMPLTAGAGDAGSTELLPDLRTRELRDIRITPDGSGRELRFTNDVLNAGPGALQVDPDPPGSGDCDGDGDVDNDRTATQRIYVDADADGVFRRSEDASYVSRAVGCMAFHPAHDHWHFNDFARYKLRRNSTGRKVATSTKVSFCMRDSRLRAGSIPGSPSSEYFEDCAPDSTMGISVGWSDEYDWGLPDQDLDVTGVPEGWYCLSSTADPDERLAEGDDSNNRESTKVRITAGGARVSDNACGRH